MNVLDGAEWAPGFADIGVRAFTTSRDAGSFGVMTDEPVRDVFGRWTAIRESLRPSRRLATVSQVHGGEILEQREGWEGWLRGGDADGSFVARRGTALAVTVADCVPVLIAHPSGAVAAIHSGWRGTASNIVERGIRMFAERGLSASELRIHLGPAICGQCYEVSSDVYARLTGRDPGGPKTVDLRGLIAGSARRAGVSNISSSDCCTRCDNDRFFSHRAGDAGRQIGVIVADA